MTKSVYVIGAGICGISAVKSLVEEGLNPTCYESRKDVGGVWNHNKAEKINRGRGYKSLITNTSKEINCFSDFPFPKNSPPFLNTSQMQEYLKSYIQHFELEKYFHLGKEVVSVEEQDVESSGKRRWRVTIRDVESCDISSQEYDYVMICTGEFGKAKWPEYEGLNRDEFKGRIMHSYEYESADEFEGLDVLVIGLGSCGGDIAADVSLSARKTVLSTRSGAYVIPRTYKNGVPFDVMTMSRITTTLEKILPTWVGDWIVRKFIICGTNHKVLGIESKYAPTCPVATMLVSDDLGPRILCGKVAIKPDVKMATADEVYFVDGSKQRFDVVICATGLTPHFPFISDDILPDRASDMKLFEWMIPFNIRDPSSLSVMGLIPFAPLPGVPRFECQTRYMAQVIAGLIDLPLREEMRKAFEKERSNFTQFEHLGRPFVFRGTMGMGYAYPDRIAAMGGFYPSFWSLIFRDPVLAMAVHFGPYVGYHYRLVGRHSNPEFARERIMNVMKNTLAGIPQRDT